MNPYIPYIAFIFISVCGVATVLYLMFSNMLPDDYKKLKAIFPQPLKKLSSKGASVNFIAMRGGWLDLDIYEDKIILSTLGKALCLDYFSYSFTRRDLILTHTLIIRSVHPLKEKNHIKHLISYRGNINITIDLAERDIDFILDLVEKAHQNVFPEK